MVSNTETSLIFFVNGKKVVDKEVNPEWTLLYYLRNKLLLCGTKLGCAEGGCGACTVMVSKYERQLQKVVHYAINACLAPVCGMHGLAVTTVEGIGSTKTKLHPVQEIIAKAHGSQCGFCTPGIVMSMYALLRNMPKPSMKDLEIAFQGNLCRCTGYRPIIEGYKTFTEDWELMQNGNAPLSNGNGLTNGNELANGNGTCGMGDKCCKLQNGCNATNQDEEEALFKAHEFAPYDATQEPIFPPELKLYDTLDRQNLIFKGKDTTWFRPTTLNQLLELKQQNPEAKIIVGNTEVGVEVKFKHCVYPVRIQSALVPEMVVVRKVENGLKIGASVSLQNMESALKERIKVDPESKTRIFVAIVEMLHWFAGKQIRNVASVGGNIMTGSPISDLSPILIACKVQLELQSAETSRTVTMDDKFFTGYRQSIVKKDEVLVALTIPYTEENQYCYAYKQARRRDDDTAIVNSAINVTFEPKSIVIKSLNLAFGGMGPTTVTTPTVSKNLIGQPWDQHTLDLAYKYLIEDLPLPPSAPGGMVQYRRALTLSFFFKAFLTITEQLQHVSPHITLDESEKSALRGFSNQIPKSSQLFQVTPSQEKNDTIGQPIPHVSAFKQATGEAVYCDDIPPYSNELYMSFILSSKAHANIISIDASEALNMEGVHAFFSAKDIREDKNQIGASRDEVVFVSKTVTSQGQILGAIIAENQMIAQKAARSVQVSYEELEPVIVSLDDAIKYKSYFTELTNPRKIEKGDVDKVFATAAHVIEGDCRSGTQEHFYLETQCTIAVPKNEDNEMEIFCSTQFPTCISKLIAHVLDVPQNRVITKVKRMGGAFGGKENKAAYIAIPAALAASSLNRPIRCMLDRDEDILITGARHAFYIKYKAAFDNDGKILGCETYLYNNAGYSNDLSELVMERAMFHFENSYKIPNIRVVGYVCKTNLPSNMAFRGFGAPQAMLAAEFMIRKVAEHLKKDVVEISRMNLYRDGDITHYNQTLEYCPIERCWDQCVASSQIITRRVEIDKYNKENRWKKRGISMVPTKYGVAFPKFLNQAGALIHVYTDGSVLLTHGGAEMGQGLHTKMIQVASRVLGIPHHKIYISETSTDKVPNTSPTAASFSSDLNGMAVMDACEIIKKRLKPYKEANSKGTWEDWVLAAYMDRVSLSTTGFYLTPNFIGYDWETNSGGPYHYFTCGVACSEVEIDCLTGDHQVLRTDIVMDIGESMNPAIDIGQIEGAFMQGYGLYMLEEMMFSPDGTTLTRGPGAYKLPGFGNIPTVFNVSLLKGAPNPRAIYSSKAVGEPPLFLASSVLFSVREAVKAARSDAGLLPTDFKLYAPVTSAKIRMACQDHLTAKLDEAKPGTFTPWNVIP